MVNHVYFHAGGDELNGVRDVENNKRILTGGVNDL